MYGNVVQLINVNKTGIFFSLQKIIWSDLAGVFQGMLEEKTLNVIFFRSYCIIPD
jgi:hypothetical protein